MVPANLRFKFTLVSYNILSQTLLNEHRYLYNKCNPKDLEWPRRGYRIVNELLSDRADIICLQEVETEHLNSLYRPKLARKGYECLYKKKTGYHIDGCAIFFKTNQFELLNHKAVEFRRTDLSSLLSKDNVGIIAVLKPKSSHCLESSKIVIANTHLLFNPKRQDIRLAQLKHFLSELQDISSETKEGSSKDSSSHLPTILCGDMNSLPNSPVSEFIINNSNPSMVDSPDEIQQRLESDSPGTRECPDILQDDLISNLNHNFKFKSVYPSQDKRGNSFISTLSSCIVDYIFYTHKNIRLECYKELLTQDELLDHGPIPNSQFPSDHLTLKAKFSLIN